MLIKTGIYKITNKINNKCYIGQSQNIEVRWRHHKNDSQNKNRSNYNYPLYRAFRKYGIKNFSFEILEECSKKDLDKKEEYYINYYNSIEKGYNQVLVNKTSAKITPKEVLEIIELLKNDEDLSTEEIAKMYNITSRSVRSINSGETWRDNTISYPIRIKRTWYQDLVYCIDCGKKINKNSIRCRECNQKEQKRIAIENSLISREELKNLIRTLPFTQIGKMYNVTDNTIKKWCDRFNLPRTKKEINSYSNEEWNLI